MKSFIFNNKFLLSSILLIILIISNFDKVRSFARANLPHQYKVLVKEIFFGKKYLDEVNFYRQLGYNRFQLPQSQFVDFEFRKIPLKDLEGVQTHYNIISKNKKTVNKFFLEDLDDSLLIASATGEFKISIDYKFDNFEKIDTNLKDLNVFELADISVVKNNIFISYTIKNNDKDCVFVSIAKANINKAYLFFELFYTEEKCTFATNGIGGRIYPYNFNNKEGFLFTTAATGKMRDFAQDLDSFFGKIWFFDLSTKKKNLFSSGHRNPQGLIVFENQIISTEHGPYGGDEINKINFGNNYGYPISSYGELYSFKFEKEKLKKPLYELSKSHIEMNFEEPIFSFVPSIGISEIERIPNDFSSYWADNFLITSLNGRTIYRIKFDKNYNKVIYSEPMFLGERIRDIKYINSQKIIALALEETGSIGIISSRK